MKEAIVSILNGIYNITSRDNSPSISLMVGKPGIDLYNFLYIKYFKKGIYTDEFISSIKELAKNAVNCDYPTFCNGKAGINWFFKYMYTAGAIDKNDLEFITSHDETLEYISIEMVKKSNTDFLHGAIGIATYLLFSQKMQLEKYFKEFIKNLEILTIGECKNTFLPFYNFETGQVNINITNISLSHGITSILKFCLQCYKLNLCADEVLNLAYCLINYLLSNTNADKEISYYPSTINNCEKTDSPSRLGWCYGDLSIGFVLYQTGVAFNDAKVKSFAIEVLKHSARRRKIHETSINDAGICHGSAGVAHIYNKMWHNTKEIVFKDACDFWIKETIDFAIREEGGVNYRRFNGKIKAYEIHNGLLTGSAGVGLVLLSYLIDDFSWDYCLMLND